MTNPAVAGLLAELSDVLARLGAAMQPETRGPDVDEAPPVRLSHLWVMDFWPDRAI